ncbi:MAG: UDP-2,3-diacylglucosamine diphosphatase [Flavobacteriaceae bacterium]|jgi:UDP-2,3-diacylglucosamine pyrophosphatase LpxH|nr:UDP-2,3-diacylglucosamine diphosphatase [Flavobacteriaceae bacterium]
MSVKRTIDLTIISDVHLGTYGSRAKELLQYLNSIQPGTLILNGDIIDIWQFKKRYFPKSHLKVLKKFIELAAKGTEVIYITGNHDEMLRKFSDLQFGKITLANKKMLELGNKKVWIFHGDVFDASVQHSKWIAKLGGIGYDLLIRINNLINWFLVRMGREKYSLSKQIKNSVKEAVKYISNFENTATELAIENGYDYVICGHIHQPQMREIQTKKGKCTYLNSGDWIENLTALEYHQGKWSLFSYEEHKHELKKRIEDESPDELTLEALISSVTKFNS